MLLFILSCPLSDGPEAGELVAQEEMLGCRARATEAVGIIAHAVGLQAAQGHLHQCLVAALEVSIFPPTDTSGALSRKPDPGLTVLGWLMSKCPLHSTLVAGRWLAHLLLGQR